MNDWIGKLRCFHFCFKYKRRKKKFELYTGYLEDEFSCTHLKDKEAGVLGFSDIIPEELKHETFGPNIIETFRKISTEKSKTDGFSFFLNDYVHLPYRDYESYLRILSGLNEEDIQLILKQYNSKIVTSKVPPGSFTSKDLSSVLSRGFNNEFDFRGQMRPNHKHDLFDSFIIDSDNVSLITKLKLGPQIMVLRFDKNSFFTTIFSSTAYWDYKDFGNEYYGRKNKNLSTMKKIHIKCDCIDDSVLKGGMQSILYSFVIDKSPG